MLLICFSLGLLFWFCFLICLMCFCSLFLCFWPLWINWVLFIYPFYFLYLSLTNADGKMTAYMNVFIREYLHFIIARVVSPIYLISLGIIIRTFTILAPWLLIQLITNIFCNDRPFNLFLLDHPRSLKGNAQDSWST